MERIVVVGASLAGLRAAEALRALGFAGRLDVVGEEPHRPYSRPPLSKGLLLGEDTPAGCELPGARSLEVEWRLGQRTERLDPDRREVVLQNGERLPYDGLVIATGSRARPWPAGRTPPGVMTLRGMGDALALKVALQRRPRRLLVVGASFIGGEVASSATALGIPVTMVELEAVPLERVLGDDVGAFIADLHRRRGVDLRTGATVEEFVADGDVLRGARLTSGDTVEAELCVVGLGAVPNVEWLVGADLHLNDGVVCRADLRAVGSDRIVAAGDVARWPHSLFDWRPVAVRHWTNAAEQGAHAARTLLAANGERAPFAAVPTFWSDQHGLRLRSVGLPELATSHAVLEGSLDEARFVVGYERCGTLVGALAVNMNRRLAAYRALVEERGTMREAIELAAGPAGPRSIDAIPPAAA
jgi:NADPH-dependent 2,4-dienoyl-CoA reductase/sulfur reductase-like enzyme